MTARAGLERLRRSRADQGFSLVELLVAMVITSIFLTIVTALFVVVVRTTSDSNSTRTATGTAGNAIAEVSRVIRVATATATGTDAFGNQTLPTAAITAGTATSLSLTSNIGGTPASPAPVLVTFTVGSQGQLIEAQTPATLTNGLWTYGSTTSSRIIAAPVLTTGSALFTYNDSTGAPITLGSSGLTATQCSQVASVTVTITVANPQIRTASTPIVLVNRVGMPNLALTGGGS